MRLDTLLFGTSVFLSGMLCSILISSYFGLEFEAPFGAREIDNSIVPSDFVDEKDIAVYNDRVVIKVNGASVGKYAPTGSMIPVLDANSNGIRIRPASEEQIDIGDIITFRQDGVLIIHRVVEKGVDGNGVYFITKGDNNNVTDGKIRFTDIEYITIGIIY